MVQIQLNADMIFRTPAVQERSGLLQTFGTLVHEMLHAYFVTTCTIPQIEKYGGGLPTPPMVHTLLSVLRRWTTGRLVTLGSK